MTNLKSSSVFLVDDDSYSLAVYEQHLSNLGYTNVKCFNDGSECIGRLKDKPSIIFLDYNMKPMNGLDTLKKIKALDPNTCVVFISGQDDLDVAVNALKCGAFDYILKGSSDLSLITKVMEKLEKAQSLKQENEMNEIETAQQFSISNRWYSRK